MSAWPTLRVAWRIVWDVVVYRVRKREAANLGTSVTLALALRVAPWELTWRAAFAVVLNVFVYLVNDCFDVAIDLRAPGRDTQRTRFLSDHVRTAWGACAGLAVLLLAMGTAFHGALLAAALVNIAVIVAYSAVLKHRPGLDLVAMGIWGVSMAMAGFPVNSPAGWRLAGLLGLLSTVTESVQVLRDEPSDRAAGVRTTAVVLGPGVAAWLARALLVTAGVYTALVLGAWGAAAVILAGLAVPLRPDGASRSWDVFRLLFGTAWLWVLARHRLG